jgi:hypothetical protein
MCKTGKMNLRINSLKGLYKMLFSLNLKFNFRGFIRSCLSFEIWFFRKSEHTSQDICRETSQ